MHDEMLRSILRAPILFFDSNPIGRVLNRFSKDIGFTDNVMPDVIFDFYQLIFIVVSGVIVLAIGNIYILIILLPLFYFFMKLRNYYMLSSRELKRIEALARSPVLSHLSETLDGLVTIRAFHHIHDFINIHYSNIDNNMAAYFAFFSSARWLGTRLDMLCMILFSFACFGAVTAKIYHSGIDPTILAVGILYTQQLFMIFQWTVRQSAEVENLMVSVERIVSYINILPEPPLLSKEMKIINKSNNNEMIQAIPPPNNWPTNGLIEANHLICSYRKDLKPVIQNVSFTIQPGQRVGIVGRTGAGKSSLMSALLRLIDITDGTLLIDGINILNIGLHELRPKISVIPQVPFLFLGTIRQNLDMFHQHTDTEIWQALDTVSLRNVLNKKVNNINTNNTDTISLVNPLDAEVAENGVNYSVGERQLLCLCRAILQKNKILIMDEV